MSVVISGIHNYCDRWCERCAFTAKCEVGLQEFNRMMSDDYKELSIEESLEIIKEQFAEIKMMLTEQVEDMGIDVDNLPERSEPLPMSKKESTVMELCKEYSRIVAKFLKEHQPEPVSMFFWNDDESDLNDLKYAANRAYENHYETLSYYQHMIPVKCNRALVRHEYDDDCEDVQSDNNGTAKLLLILCKACTEALSELYKVHPENDDIIDMLNILRRIIQGIESLFPRAYEFVRPGFDE